MTLCWPNLRRNESKAFFANTPNAKVGRYYGICIDIPLPSESDASRNQTIVIYVRFQKARRMSLPLGDASRCAMWDAGTDL